MNQRAQIAIFLFILICTLTSILLWGRLRRKENWKTVGQDCKLYLPGYRQEIAKMCKHITDSTCTETDLQNLAALIWPNDCGSLSTKRQNNFTQGAIRAVPRTDNGFADTGPAIGPFMDYLK